MHTDTHAIRHRLEIEASPQQVFDAITRPDQLARWWTPRVQAEPKAGTTAIFRFGDGSYAVHMHLDRLEPGRRVHWTCVEGDWRGHHFHFDIEPHERGALLRFTHGGWPTQEDFYMHCNAKWGFFLSASLKALLEGRVPVPHPNEPKI